jgi:quinol monooxygenase YgiN
VVVFINKLTLTGSAEELERRYAHVAEFMKAQDGIIRYQLMRSQKDANVYFNVAEWVDKAALDRALTSPEFRTRLAPVMELIKGDPHVADIILGEEVLTTN